MGSRIARFRKGGDAPDAKADNNEAVQLNSDRIKLQTKGPTDVRVQTITFAPGGRSGWNHKPGFVLVAVLSGEVTKFDSHCNGTTYGPDSPNGAVFSSTATTRRRFAT